MAAENYDAIFQNVDGSDQTSIETAVEAIIDASSAARVIEALFMVCHAKADHLRSNWQDAKTANTWERLAHNVDKCTKYAESL